MNRPKVKRCAHCHKLIRGGTCSINGNLYHFACFQKVNDQNNKRRDEEIRVNEPEIVQHMTLVMR